MKFLINSYIFLFAILSINNASAQSALIAEGMQPIGINNLWIYDNFSSYSIWKFSDDIIIIDSIQYNILNVNYISPDQYVRLREDGYFVLRRDSTYNEPNHEEIYYKKDAEIGENWTQHMYGDSVFTYTSVVTDTFLLNIFDTLVTGKVVRKDLGLVLLDQLWTEEFGLISTADFHSMLDYLIGCVINGNVYGDTSTTDIQYESIDILPDHPLLFQNYPNPFNPTTAIRFIIPERSKLKIKVYNSIGEEIITLLDQSLERGEHTMVWNGRDKSNFSVPSGIYFISMEAGSFHQTIKSVIIK